MALPAKTQVKFWGIASAVFLIVLWFLGDVILPFVLGAAIAYFLDPATDRLESAGMSRAVAVTLITAVVLMVFVVVSLLIIPTLIQQAVNLFNVAPQLFNDLQGFLTDKFPSIVDEDSTLRQSLVAVGETIRDRGGQLLESALTSGVATERDRVVRGRAGGGLLPAL